MTNSGRYWEVTGGHHANYSVDILLDPELHASFCRRGRRRLKAPWAALGVDKCLSFLAQEIQMSSRAQLKFDRQRGAHKISLHALHSSEVCSVWAALRPKWPRCNDSLLAKKSMDVILPFHRR